MMTLSPHLEQMIMMIAGAAKAKERIAAICYIKMDNDNLKTTNSKGSKPY